MTDLQNQFWPAAKNCSGHRRIARTNERNLKPYEVQFLSWKTQKPSSKKKLAVINTIAN